MDGRELILPKFAKLKSMPKVLRIFNRFVIGGPVLNAMILTKYLSPEFETKLITGIEDKGEHRANFLIDEYGIEPVFIDEMRRSVNPLQDVVAYRVVSKIIKEFKPDIVHTHAAKAGAIGRAAAAAAKVPVIVHTFHGHSFHSYFNKMVSQAFINIERGLAKRSTKIIAISEMQKKELVEQFRICGEDKMVVLPNGIDLTKFSTEQEEKRAVWRKKFNIPQDALLVGIIGRMAPIKNHVFFVEVVEKCLQACNSEKLHFVIVGDGETRQATETLLNVKNISFNYFPENQNLQKVLFTSWEKEMDYVYSGLDIVCLTSLNEGTPISVIESQAARRPVVSTNVGAVADTMVNEVSGYLIDNFDAADFSEKVCRLIGDETLRARMGEAGKDFVYRTYSHLRLVEDMRQLYRSLLK